MKIATREQIEEVIVNNYPEQVDYWLHKKSKKHSPITLTIKCQHCGYESSATISNRAELRRLYKRECPGCDAYEKSRNEHLNVRIPLGKFRGMTVNYVMDNEPSYLAWFVDHVKGQDSLIEQIKTHTRFPQVWAKYVEKETIIRPNEQREAREWQQGRFSQRTIDDLCGSLFA